MDKYDLNLPPPSRWEIKLSKLECLIDETKGKPINKHYWEGYHPRAYGKARLPTHEEELHKTLREYFKCIPKLQHTSYTLEMQIWLRDHLKSKEDLKHDLLSKLKDNIIHSVSCLFDIEDENELKEAIKDGIISMKDIFELYEKELDLYLK